MRPIKRIDKFFEHNILDRLHDDDVFSNQEFKNVTENFDKFKEYWYANPDQRFRQVLINLGLIEDSTLFFKEDFDVLMQYEIYLGDIVTWTSYYDKNENLLDEPITKYIKDLDTSHLHAIKRFAYKKMKDLPLLVKYCIDQEIEIRHEEEKMIKMMKEEFPEIFEELEL